ncbi:putative pentatricopeptide repeat-containing protein At5g06400, mitochondrial [Herrania umbratica]|uniref:Pentatricopeptide repeat-containing protein At5g06400, mitochondrial n=1 Tax=Herrania umbratica TaxID=108875 RepID=A0A6J1ATH9_9ROSI|nr:putative pentatricopeptide repeat-containing protein At5g06400, mitochondrial [Herrania umbratica]
MRNVIRFQLFRTEARTDLSRLYFARLKPLHLSTLPKPQQTKKPPQTNLKNQSETCSIPSLFHEITEVLGAVNLSPDDIPSGFSISNKTNCRELQFMEESLSRRSAVCQNSQEKSKLVEKEENITVLDDTQMGNSVEFDVSPVVHEITKIVRGENALVAMEDQLEKSGFSFEPDIVEKVLKRCFKVPHLAFRFFGWVKLREGFRHTTGTFNTILYIAGEAKEYGLVEQLLEEMEEKSCKKDIKTCTILISQYGKSKLIGKALEVFENMRRCGCEPDAAAYRMMIRALCNAEKCDIAFEFYKEMVEKEMSLDLNLYKMLLNCLAKSGKNAAVHLVADNMMRVSQVPEQEVYGYVLKSFCISGRIREALELIRDLKKKDLSLDHQYFETLVKGLCRADRIGDALEIVDIMKRRQLASHKVDEIIINGYLRRKDLSKALDLFKSMQESGYLPTASAYTELMQHLFRLNKYQKGCDLYNEMLEKGVEPDSVAIMAMVAGHVHQKHISEAWEMFKSMEDRGIRPTWTAYSIFIKELCKIARTDEIFRVLSKMQEAKIVIRDEIFHWVISCMERKGEMDNVEKVKQMRRKCKPQSQKGEVFSNNALKGQKPLKELEHNLSEPERTTDYHLVQTLSKAYNVQDLEEVCRILSSSKEWCIAEEALERCNIQFTPELVVEILRKSTLYGRSALNFFSWVGKQVGYWHTTETYNMAIKISGCGKDFVNMRRLFYEMKRRGCLTTPNTWAIMILQYGRTGMTEIALRTFAEMKTERFNPTASTYKYLIISLCGKKGRKVDETIKIFQEMIHAGHRPDKELLETYLGCLCEVGKLLEARSCTDSLSKVGFTVPLSYSLYIRALCRAGRLEEALEMLDNVGTEQASLDLYVYGSLVHGLLQKGRFEQALAKVDSMTQAGIYPTVHVYTSLIVHFFKERQMERALGIFAKMKKEGCQPTIVTYSAMIRGYMNIGKVVDAWNVFHHIRLKGPKPDFKTYSMFISCLCRIGRSEEAMQLLSEMPNSGILPSTVNFRTVFFGLNRQGRHDLAQIVLQQKSALKSERKL